MRVMKKTSMLNPLVRDFGMEWNAKASPSQWDWENSTVFPGKISEISKQAQHTDWGIEEDGGIDVVSFQTGNVYSFGGVGGGGVSGSDLGSGSSSKCMISASVDSSAKGGMQNLEFNFKTVEALGIKDGKGRDTGILDLCYLVRSSLDMQKEGSINEFKSNLDQNGSSRPLTCGVFSKDLTKMKDCTTVEDTSASPPLVAPTGSGETLLGLKLGKRTYFEDTCVGNTINASSFSSIPASSPVSIKKARASYRNVQNARCQVEGCNVDLSSSKDYHWRHKVCESHSKSPKVIVAGQERRFCQQCSRFHDLLEFDEKKRSCRRRLSDHNARRRKQQPEALSFNSARLSSSLYDGRQQMNLVLDRVPLVHARSLANPTWEEACDIKFAQTKGSCLRTGKVGGFDAQLHMPGIMDLPNAIYAFRHDFDRSLPFKGTATEVLHQGLEASLISSNLTVTPDPRCALSLLSNNIWGSPDPEPISLDQLVPTANPSIAQPVMHAVHQGLPLAGSVIWQSEQSLPEGRTQPSFLHDSGNQFQEFELFRVPYESSIPTSCNDH